MSAGRPQGLGAEAAIALLAAAIVGIAGLVWAATSLSAVLFGGGWPGLRFADAFGALWRLPSNLGVPAEAWPPGSRRSLADPAVFYATLAIVTIVAAALLGTAIEGALAARRRLGGRGRVPAARWAARRDLRALHARAGASGRVGLGAFHRWHLAAEERASVMVVAPTQSGKTTGIAIPAILEWDGPVLATSVKADLLRETLARRQQVGRVEVFDPTGAGMPSASWSPLGSSGSWHGAQRMASWLCESARAGNLEEADFWYGAAAKLLAPYLFAAATSAADMETVVRWIDTQEELEVARALELAGNDHALQAARATWMREDRQRSSIYTTAETVLSAYGDPRVMACSRRAEVSPAALLDGGAHTLYLCSPAHEQRRLAPLFAALVEELVAVVYDFHAASGGGLERPLLLVLDELANIAPIRSLPQIASTGAGQGIQLVSIFQDLAQVEQRWGKSWRTVANSHRAKLFGTGISDPGTLSYVRELTGESEFEHRSDTSGQLGQHSSTTGATYRAIAPSNVVREANPATAVLVYGSLPPAQLRLRQWFNDRRLRELASGQTAAPAPAEATPNEEPTWEAAR